MEDAENGQSRFELVPPPWAAKGGSTAGRTVGTVPPMPTNVQLAWLKSMVPAAQTCARLWKVPASVTLAQAALESAWGTSQLSRRCNNYFGIKAVQGEDYAEFTTREVVSGRSVMELARFAKYGSVLDCFAAHAHLLASHPRYAKAMAVSTVASSFAVGLQMCGYSTSEIYGQSLIELMEQLNLYQYDPAEWRNVTLDQETA